MLTPATAPLAPAAAAADPLPAGEGGGGGAVLGAEMSSRVCGVSTEACAQKHNVGIIME